jgi:outer membrane protein
MNRTLLSIVTAALISSGAAFAHETQNTVVVLDFQKMFQDSLAGKDFNTKLENKRKALEDSRNKKESELVKMNEDLKKQQSVLSSDAFDKKRKDFEAKIQSFQQELQEEGMKFEKDRNEAVEQVENATKQILADLAKDKGYQVVVSKNAVVYNADNLDISNEVLKKLDTKIKTVNLK